MNLAVKAAMSGLAEAIFDWGFDSSERVIVSGRVTIGSGCTRASSFSAPITAKSRRTSDSEEKRVTNDVKMPVDAIANSGANLEEDSQTGTTEQRSSVPELDEKIIKVKERYAEKAEKLKNGPTGITLSSTGTTLVPVVATIDVYEGSLSQLVRWETTVFVDCGHLPPDHKDWKYNEVIEKLEIATLQPGPHLVAFLRKALLFRDWPCLACGSRASPKAPDHQRGDLIFSIIHGSTTRYEFRIVCESKAKCKEALDKMVQEQKEANPVQGSVFKEASVVIPCIKCGKRSEPNNFEALQRCSRCHVAVYCGGACQKKDWPRHQEWCGHLPKRPKGGVINEISKMYGVTFKR